MPGKNADMSPAMQAVAEAAAAAEAAHLAAIDAFMKVSEAETGRPVPGAKDHANVTGANVNAFLNKMKANGWGKPPQSTGAEAYAEGGYRSRRRMRNRSRRVNKKKRKSRRVAK